MDLQVYDIEGSSIWFTARRKLHICDMDSGKCLCGCQSPGTSTLVSVDKAWLTQPDPDDMICKKCKKKALKLLEQEEKK